MSRLPRFSLCRIAVSLISRTFFNSLSLSVCVCLSVSICVSVSVCVSVRLSLSVCLQLAVLVSLHVETFYTEESGITDRRTTCGLILGLTWSLTQGWSAVESRTSSELSSPSCLWPNSGAPGAPPRLTGRERVPIDDLTRIPPELFQSMMTTAQERRFGQHVLLDRPATCLAKRQHLVLRERCRHSQ